MTEKLIYTESFFAMGTRCDVVLFDVNHEFGKQLFQILKKEVERLEAKLSSAVFDSPVGILNRAQKNIWLDVDPELWEILTLCFDFYQLSNGAFDITISQLVNLWKNEGKEIDTGQILKAKNSSGFDKIELDINKQKLKFLTDHVEFNIGGIVKAYTLDSLNGIFKKQGVTNAIISFGESSVLALGNHPNGNVWPLGIQNVLGVKEFVHIFDTSNETITTSATIVNSDNNEIRRLIISPETGMPVEGERTVSVKSESATLGEFLSISWLILPENDRIIMSEKFRDVEILEVNYINPSDYKTKLTIL